MIKYPRLEDQKNFNRVFYKNFYYLSKIIKINLTNKYYINILINGLELKKLLII